MIKVYYSEYLFTKDELISFGHEYNSEEQNDDFDEYSSVVTLSDHDAEVAELKEQLEKAEKVIEFYADISNQSEFVCLNGSRDSEFGGININDFEYIEISKKDQYSAQHYGKLARQYLKSRGDK